MPVNAAKVRRPTPVPRPSRYQAGRTTDRVLAERNQELESRLEQLTTRLGALEQQLSTEAELRAGAQHSEMFDGAQWQNVFGTSHRPNYASVLPASFDEILPAIRRAQATFLSNPTYALLAAILVLATVVAGAAVDLKQRELTRATDSFSSPLAVPASMPAREQAKLGLAYLNGQGVAKDVNEAVRFLAAAAKTGEPVAQYWLGTLYEHGNGEPANLAAAKRLYEASAVRGNVRAMYKLAVAYAEGRGAPQSYEVSARWFVRAAKLGFVNAQYNLGVLYERGLGVPQNLDDAYKWYALAAARGDKGASERVEILTSQMGADDLAAAREAAAEFRPLNRDPGAN